MNKSATTVLYEDRQRRKARKRDEVLDMLPVARAYYKGASHKGLPGYDPTQPTAFNVRVSEPWTPSKRSRTRKPNSVGAPADNTTKLRKLLESCGTIGDQNH